MHTTGRSPQRGRNQAAGRLAPVLLLALSGCAFRVAPAWTPAPPPMAGIRVFYATDRKPAETGDKPCPGGTLPFSGPRFGPKRAEDGRSRFGAFALPIPPGHQMGRQLTSAPLPRCWSLGSLPVYGPGPTAMTQPEWYAALRQEMAQSGRHDILVFLHGTRFRFEESATWAGQFAFDVQFPGPVIAFAWPSGEGRWDYMEGEANAEWSRPHLLELLRGLEQEFPEARLHLVAHSLGARLVAHTLAEWGERTTGEHPPRLGQVVLAAADVDSEIFRRLLARARPLAQRWTIYVAADDKALGASAKVHGYPRTGRDLGPVEGVDVIDASYTDGSDYRHNYFTQNRRVLFDLFQLLREGTPPEKRFGLVRQEQGGRGYWQLRP